MKFLKICFLLSLITFSTSAQDLQSKLELAYQRLVNDSQAQYAITSLCVLDAQTGKIIFGKNENVGLATASTLKIITSATAFSLLGANFKYETSLCYSGKIGSDGILQGDIIIVGSGDPTLASWRYEQTKERLVLNKFVTAIKTAGIKKIEGNIIGNDSLFGTQTTPDGWIWQDIGNYYGSGTSALTWRENQFDIHLKTDLSADSAVKILKTVPHMPYLQIINELNAGEKGTGDNAYVFLPPYSNLAYLRGTWETGLKKNGISAALPDPAYDAAFRLADTLNSLGVKCGLGATTARRLALSKKSIPQNVQKLTAIFSPSLSDIVYWFNKKSINLYGEQLLKTLAWKTGQAPSTKNGANVMIDYWASKGIDKNALNIIDGSGLSPSTRISTLAMAQILFQAQKEPWFGAYLNSFPDNNGMQLKSGFINNVSAYAGYYTDVKGNKYIAVININNYNGKNISKKLFAVLNVLK